MSCTHYRAADPRPAGLRPASPDRPPPDQRPARAAGSIDADGLASRALGVLRGPKVRQAAGARAAAVIEERYAQSVGLPRPVVLFDRAAAGR